MCSSAKYRISSNSITVHRVCCAIAIGRLADEASAVRQNIAVVVELDRQTVDDDVKMNTYDSHVQEFVVCCTADDWTTWRENNTSDWAEIRSRSESVGTNGNSTCTSSPRRDCCTWSRDASVDRYCADWCYTRCIRPRLPANAWRHRDEVHGCGNEPINLLDRYRIVRVQLSCMIVVHRKMDIWDP